MTAIFEDGLANDAYHARPELGSTSLKTLATKTPAHYQWSLTNKRTTDAFDLGTAVHSVILEDDKSGIEVIDVTAKRGKAWTEPATLARAEGKIPLTAAEWKQVMGMWASVMNDDEARALVTGHVAERSIFWEKDGVGVKCRPDALHPDVIVDLKTTRTADPNEFPRIAHQYGYHQSAALYTEGVQALTGERLPFKFLLIEKEPPYLCSVVWLDDMSLERGAELNTRALNTYRECTTTNQWPGYQHQEVTLPPWAYDDNDYEEMEV